MTTQTNKNQALEEAVHSYLKTGTKQAKEQVVQHAESLVTYYASLYSPGQIDEDIKQAAYEGLLKALKRFDPTKGVLFSTYAVHCMIGEMRHDLRDRGPFKVPEWIQEIQAKIINATEELAQKNKTMPSLAEIAQKANVTEEGIIEAMQIGCVSLDDADLTKVKSLRYESFKLPIEDVITVKMSLEKMDDLQQKVIKHIYYEGLTQEETAQRLGINQRKVSRIMNKSLVEMRAYVL